MTDTVVAQGTTDTAAGEGRGKDVNVSDAQTPDVKSSQGRVVFTVEQQSYIQRLMDEQSGRYKKNIAEMEAGLKEKSKTRDNTLPDGAISQLKQQVESLRNEKKTSELLKAISRHNVIDAGEIAELTGRYLKLNDDNSLSVINDGGELIMNAGNSPMSIDEFVAGWIKTRPHHLRASGTSGSGSTSAMFGGQPTGVLTPESIREMSNDEFRRAISEGVNIAGSSGQTYKFKSIQNPFKST